MGRQYETSLIVPSGSIAPIVLSGFGHAPAVVQITWNGADDLVDAAEGVSSLRGYAILTPTTHIAISEVLRDGQSFMIARGRVDSDRVIQEFSDIGSELGRLNLTSFDADGITLTPAVAFTSGLHARVLSWSSDLIPQASLFAFRHSQSIGDDDITGVTVFEPNGAIFVGPNADTTLGGGPFTVGAGLSMGFAAGPNGSIQQAGGVAYSDAGNFSTFAARGAGLNGYSVLQLQSGSTPTGVVAFAGIVTQWLPTGLRLNQPAAPPDTTRRLIVCLAMQGDFSAGSFSTGAAEIAASSPPTSGVFFSTGLPAVASPPSASADDAHSLVGFAALNENEGLSQSCMGVLDVGGVSPRDVSRRIDLDSIVAGLAPGGSALGEVRIDLPKADGYELESVEAFAAPAHVAYLLAGPGAGEGVTHGRQATVATESRRAEVPAEPVTATVP